MNFLSIIQYEEYALEHSCNKLQIDTCEINMLTCTMYRKHGFEDIGITTSKLNGISDVTLVMLEKHLAPKRELYLKQ